MEDIKEVEELALNFRLAIENMTEDDFIGSPWFSSFPRGCCGDASELLAKYFIQNGISVEYVWGMNKNQSHAWLEYMGYIIDITADQFLDINDKIVISKDKKWHSKFKRQSRRNSNFEIDNEINRERLGELYRNITARIHNIK